MRIALALLFLIPAACTAPGAREASAPQAEEAVAESSAVSGPSEASASALLRPVEADGRSQRERDLEIIGRAPAPPDQPR